MATIEDRQRGLFGSSGAFVGPGGCGKSFEALCAAIASAMLVGGMCLVYDPSGSVSSDVKGYRDGAVAQLDSAKASGATLQRRAYLARRLDFLRYRVRVYPGRDAHRIFDDISDVIGDGKPHSSMYGSVLIDESFIARGETGFLESIVPLARNAGIMFYFTAQRWMGIPPAARGNIRFRIMWRGADYTGDPEMERYASDPDVEFSPVMSGTPKGDQWYRGLLSTPRGIEHVQYNPNVEKRPDWLLLQAPIGNNGPMVLV